LRGYDYTRNSAYFVTFCATQRLCLFGEIKNGVLVGSAIGGVVERAWQDLPHHTPGLVLDAWVVMPNHLHGIVILAGGRTGPVSGEPAARGPRPGSLGAVIGGFKSAVSREVAARQLTLVRPLWQRNYYDRIIRSDRELEATRRYIATNPARWIDDPEHPRLHQGSR
jgi:REP element-mobilizing transposase RayT